MTDDNDDFKVEVRASKHRVGLTEIATTNNGYQWTVSSFSDENLVVVRDAINEELLKRLSK